MATVHIPDSMADAIKSLVGMNALLTAKEWERAAIVYAFTEDRQGQRLQRKVSEVRLGINEFAGIGIAGLKTADTIRVYRNAWQSAIDDGHAPRLSRPASPAGSMTRST